MIHGFFISMVNTVIRLGRYLSNSYFLFRVCWFVITLLMYPICIAAIFIYFTFVNDQYQTFRKTIY